MRFSFVFLLLSTSVFAAPICSNHYVKASQTYKSFNKSSKIYQMDRKINIPHLPKKINASNEKKVLEKLGDFYEEIYNYRLQFTHLEATDYAAKDIVDHSNLLVQKLQDVLDFKGIHYDIKTTHYMEGGLVSNHLEIAGKYVDSNDSFEVISKLKSMVNTKTVTVNPLDNILLHTHGFSDSANKRVEIGVRSLIEQLIFDEVQVTTRHEFLHASFLAKRNKGKPSIYNHSFSSYGNKNLTTNARYYNKFMSNEEVYTFANNSFWASDKFFDIHKYARIDIADDLTNIGNYLRMNEDIFSQSRKLAQETVEYLQDIIARAQNGTIAEIFPYQGKNNQKVLDHLKAEFITLDFGDGRVANVFLDDMKKEYFQKVYDVFEHITDNTITEATRINQQNFKVNYLILLKNIEEDFQKMLDLSKLLELKNQKILNQFNGLELKHRASTGLDESDYRSLMADSFVKFRTQLRKMGMMTREDYKGFMSLEP